MTRRSRSVPTPPLALTMGEPAGIGGEISLKAWLARAEGVPPYFVLDDPGRLAALAKRLGLAVPVAEIARPEEAAQAFAEGLPVLAQPLSGPVRPGRPNPIHAPVVLSAIETAVALAQEGRAAAVVTNPIHKEALYDVGFRFPGHTEYLAHLAGAQANPVMMLASDELRVVPVTIHVSLRQALADLDTGTIVHAALVTHAALGSDFGIERPRLAVAGLNPHAGEGGAMGSEEADIIAPAIAELRRRGIEVAGPVAPDALFTAQARRRYDAAICMYHDQALIPIKALAFDEAVNVTLGLPFVRTSPDHGTALNIAGKGVASERSLVAALRMAAAMAGMRARARAA